VLNRKTKTKKGKTDMLRSIGKHSGGIRGVSPEEEKEGHGGKDLQKRKVSSLERKSDGILIIISINVSS